MRRRRVLFAQVVDGEPYRKQANPARHGATLLTAKLPQLLAVVAQKRDEKLLKQIVDLFAAGVAIIGPVLLMVW